MIKLKKKTNSLLFFIDGLHSHIVCNRQFRKITLSKTEKEIQTEIRPLIIDYLKEFFRNAGYIDFDAKANKSFYWEGEEGIFGNERALIFGSRNYPDFIITNPYLIAVEYKKSPWGSTVKQGIGQSIIHTLSGDFDYVYYLFHDETEDKKIEKSFLCEVEKNIISILQSNFNVFFRFTSQKI